MNNINQPENNKKISLSHYERCRRCGTCGGTGLIPVDSRPYSLMDHGEYGLYDELGGDEDLDMGEEFGLFWEDCPDCSV